MRGKKENLDEKKRGVLCSEMKCIVSSFLLLCVLKNVLRLWTDVNIYISDAMQRIAAPSSCNYLQRRCRDARRIRLTVVAV